MPTKKSQRKHIKKRSVFVFSSLAVLLLVGAVYLATIGYYQHLRLSNALDQAEMTSIRELIVKGVNGTKVDAPIEPKSGDIYFPQANLYIPSASTPMKFAYNYYEEEQQLTITDRSIVNQQIAVLYGSNSSNVTELFENLPKLQACQRGFSLSERSTLPGEDVTLQKSVTTGSGKTYYIFLANGCEELKQALPVIETIKSY